MIKISSLHKYFNKGRQNEIHVIDDVTLSLPEKGMVAIFGKSGCGKTTLLNTIGGLDDFYSGDITVKGEQISKNTDKVRNKYIGYIFQNYNLHKEETCFENVANALYLCGITDEKIVEQRVMSALSNVGMEKYYNRTPDTLSGGQQQRIAIARAIVKNPPLILADEPTGNLDEANTIMIMDLLKEISREHLVLLVTHEANLVDYYCDTVIELSDGKVINVRENAKASGYAQRDKNAIYLGELEKNVVSDEKINIEYYGDAPETPLNLKVINEGGKIYIKIESEEVNLITKTSEIKLVEGVFVQKNEEKQKESTFQMASLPPVSGTHFGKLFGFKKAVKSGYISVSTKKKKGRKMLKRCMSLFAAVLVFMFGLFGTSVSQVIDIKKAYNNNVFYVYSKDGATSEKLYNAVGNSESGIDYVKLFYSEPRGDEKIPFYTGNFETFESYNNDFSTNGVFLDVSLTKNLKLVAGKKTDIADNEVVITTQTADNLLEKSSFGYIKEYKDLLGLIANDVSIDGKNIRIAGVVESDETAVYFSTLGIAKYVHKRTPYNICLDTDKNIDVSKGETVAISPFVQEDSLSVGDTIKIGGLDLKITKIYRRKNYDTYIADNKINKNKEKEYFDALLKEAYPDLVEGSDEYNLSYEKLYNEKYGEYLVYYFSEYDAYLRDQYISTPDSFKIWLYVNKGINIALNDINSDLGYTFEYYKQNGLYPTLKQIKEESHSIYINEDKYYNLYGNEFYASQNINSVSSFLFIVDETEYVTLSKKIGDTSSIACSSNNLYYDNYYDKEYHEGIIEVTKKEDTHSSKDDPSSKNEIVTFFGTYYTVIHSNNPEVTEKWLLEQFPNLDTDVRNSDVITPDNIFENLMFYNKEGIITSLITMVVFLAIMSVCMYFIMQSSLMSKIKEVGIYRAIGVSKKNLVYKFMIESIVLAIFTILKGFLFASGFIYACTAISPMFETIFFYPVWSALIVLAILFGLCILFGTLPVRLLLRKTPSQIIAKYDI